MTQACIHPEPKRGYQLTYGVTAELCVVCAIQIGARLGFAPYREDVEKWISSIVCDVTGRAAALEFRHCDAWDVWLDHVERCPTCTEAQRGAIDVEQMLTASCFVGLQLYALAAGKVAA